MKTSTAVTEGARARAWTLLLVPYRRWREHRMALALEALDDRTLKDMGIHRCQIRAIARDRIETGTSC